MSVDHMVGRRRQAHALQDKRRQYLSSHDTRELLGIGTASKVDWIEIKWPPPSSRVKRLTDLPIDRYVTIVEGQGRIKE